MTSTANRAVNQIANAAAAQLAAPPAHTTVAASGGSPTTSREPPGESAAAADAQHAAENNMPALARKRASQGCQARSTVRRGEPGDPNTRAGQLDRRSPELYVR